MTYERTTEKIHDDLNMQTDEVPTIESTVAHLQGSANPLEFENTSFLSEFKLTHSLCLKLSRVIELSI